MNPPGGDPLSSPRQAISHPYPPTYRSHISHPEQHQPYHSRTQPDQPPPHSFDYARRRDERHHQHPSLQPSTNVNQNLYPTSTSTPLTRDRSGSNSSQQLILPKEEGHVLGDAYPPGWSKEDEEAEKEFLRQGLFNWNEMKSWRFWVRKEWWFYYLAFGVIALLVILMTVFHDQIVKWLTPVTNWMKDLPAGWTIPIAILFVISFPPLFGHEIVAILVGAVWGLWIGFGIVAAGTFLGEVGNFYTFKYWCRARAERYEYNNLNYAVMAHVVREGGFAIIFVARLSAIPGHFTTAVFATCGMNIFIFSIACVLTMPKQLIVVYLGVIFAAKDTSSKNKIISDTVLVIGFLITIGAAWYIYHKMNKVRVIVWRKQRMALAAKDLCLDPVTGQKRASFKEHVGSDLTHSEEADVRSPIFTREAYQNEYSGPYPQADNSSMYDVDGPIQHLPEHDVGYGYHPAAIASTETFPEAHPNPSSGAAINRYPSSVTTLAPSHGDVPPPTPTNFPVPAPAPGAPTLR